MSVYTSEITPAVLRRLQDRAASAFKLRLPRDFLVCDVWRIPDDCSDCDPLQTILRCIQVYEFRPISTASLHEIPISGIKQFGFPFARLWEASSGELLGKHFLHDFIGLFDYPPRYFTTGVGVMHQLDGRESWQIICAEQLLPTAHVEGGVFVMDSTCVGCFWFGKSWDW